MTEQGEYRDAEARRRYRAEWMRKRRLRELREQREREQRELDEIDAL
ncbi:MAG TPA: hypothetical protein VEO18_05950 [Thermoplasmata archaeon]|nr:hypothetical protein [Thermoplasmata archaeon]